MAITDLISLALECDMEIQEEQCALTSRVLVSRMPELLELAKIARGKVDSKFGRLIKEDSSCEAPRKAGDTNLMKYPVGFCKPICKQVFEELKQSELIKDWVAQGGAFKTVYIMLYGKYFQNAIQIGNLYLDVANDTVDPTKHFLEWMPIEDLDYKNLECWEQVSEVVESYYHCRVIPNRYFPLLAAFVPLMVIRSNGVLELLIFQDQFFFKDLGDGMKRYIEWLSNDSRKVHRSLTNKQQRLLAQGFGSNDFDKFAFEYKPSTNEGLVQQAEELYQASQGENGEVLVRKLIELAHQSTKRFNAKEIVLS